MLSRTRAVNLPHQPPSMNALAEKCEITTNRDRFHQYRRDRSRSVLKPPGLLRQADWSTSGCSACALCHPEWQTAPKPINGKPGQGSNLFACQLFHGSLHFVSCRGWRHGRSEQDRNRMSKMPRMFPEECTSLTAEYTFPKPAQVHRDYRNIEVSGYSLQSSLELLQPACAADGALGKRCRLSPLF
jgi:hypothetical protein